MSEEVQTYRWTALLCNTLIIFLDAAQLCLLAAQEPLFLPADFVQITLTYVKASNCHRAGEAFQLITGIIASLHSHKTSLGSLAGVPARWREIRA